MAFLPIDKIRVDAEVASTLPGPDAEALAQLTADIRRQGVLIDLLVTRDGLLLDGHRRLEAARQAGLSEVPVTYIDFEGEPSWARAVAAVIGALGREVDEVRRAFLGSSLLRLERLRARERQTEGQKRGRESRWGQPMGEGLTQAPAARPGRATEKVAESVGISRHTLERVEALKANDPEAIRELLRGQISITGAYRRLRARQLAHRAGAGSRRSGNPGRVERLEHCFGKYRTVLIDLPWTTLESGAMPGPGVQTFDSLPVRQLAHAEGCHYWIPTPWAHLRKGSLQRLIDAWNVRWVAELLWDPGSAGKGRWFHARTQVLVLATTGGVPLLRSDIPPVVSALREVAHAKPEAVYQTLETLSPAPRLEMFARYARRGWDFWKANG